MSAGASSAATGSPEILGDCANLRRASTARFVLRIRARPFHGRTVRLLNASAFFQVPGLCHFMFGAQQVYRRSFLMVGKRAAGDKWHTLGPPGTGP